MRDEWRGKYGGVKPKKTQEYLRYRKLDFESCYIKPNLDCNYTFPMDLKPNGIPFGAKSNGKVILQSKIDLI